MNVSVILPTYNEKDNISALIDRLQAIFSANSIRGEIIVVDDDSPDGTADLAQKKAAGFSNIKVLQRPRKSGLASAVADGSRAAQHETIIVMDSDFSHPPGAIPEMLRHKKPGNIVSGSRFYRGRMKAPLFKMLSSIIINRLSRILIDEQIHDYTGGFFVLDKVMMQNAQISSTGGEYAIEFLCHVVKQGYTVEEIPITYVFRKKGVSKTRLFHDGPRYLKRLWKMRSGCRR